MAMDIKKLNHPVYSKLREDKARLWSFSVASSYENCAHEYYLGRILKLKGKDNIYTQSGSLSHDILETHYEDNTPREEM
ncbi:MAG: PD-(D/E)XK nuclease family protein, partial [Cetobacterium sp.]